MSEIYMIRHGQASFGEENYDRLSPLGIRQAEITAADMLKKNRRFDAVYLGTLDRQHKTADAFLNLYRDEGRQVPEPVVSPAFNEYDSESVVRHQFPLMLAEDPSLTEKMKRIKTDKKAFQQIFEKAMRRWSTGRFDPAGAPTWDAFKAGVGEGVRQIVREQGAKKRIAVFTSGGPVSVTLQAALGLSDEMAMEVSWQIMNASVTRFKYSSRGIALAGFNDIAHLELENDKSLLTYR